MMQTAIAVAAALILVGSYAMAGQDRPSLLQASATTAATPKFDMAGDGVEGGLPSSQATPASTFGTPITGASPMPSAKKYTHNMFEP